MNADVLKQAQQLDWILKESDLYLLWSVHNGQWAICDGRGSFETIRDYCEVVDRVEDIRSTDNPTIAEALQIETNSDRIRELRFEELILGSNVDQILNSTIMDRAKEYASKFLDCSNELELWYQFREDLWVVLHHGIGLEHCASFGDLWSLWTDDHYGALLSGMDYCDCGELDYLIRDGSGDLLLGDGGEVQCNSCLIRDTHDDLVEVVY